MKLFISATNVETGQLRVFETDEIDVDVVMASACLPQIFQAVEIDGAPYWDGGYGGNPALYPFFYANATEDVLLVQINPVVREGTPKNRQRNPEPHRRDHLQRRRCCANFAPSPSSRS